MKPTRVLRLLVLQILVLLLLDLPAESFVNVNSITCACQSDVCTSAFCELNRSRGKMVYISGGCVFTRPTKNVMMHVNLMRKEGNKFKSFWMDYELNLCDVTKTKETSNHYINSIVAMTSKYFKNLRCPMQGNVTLRKLPSMLHLVQSFISEGQYMIEARVFAAKGPPVLQANLSFSITMGELM